jgi:hypothetical protein
MYLCTYIRTPHTRRMAKLLKYQDVTVHLLGNKKHKHLSSKINVHRNIKTNELYNYYNAVNFKKSHRKYQEFSVTIFINGYFYKRLSQSVDNCVFQSEHEEYRQLSLCLSVHNYTSQSIKLLFLSKKTQPYPKDCNEIYVNLSFEYVYISSGKERTFSVKLNSVTQ